ncbi:MAG: DUF5312 domain-containing protein [Spirochaetaceae bacterium]|jgi:hypothetical protein|nr:DUF5312 domain-containing protein [Spirochaetaceae bacterium]
MSETGAFDHLVSNLNQDEKQKLLEKIKSRTVLSPEPLIDEKQHAVQEHPDTQYHNLPILKRIWYWLIGFFTGKSTMDVYIDSLAAAEGKIINEKNPGMFDYHEGLLKDGLYREIQNLKNAARFFYTALDSSINRNKDAFFGYLGSLEMPELHKELVEKSDPDIVHSEYPDMFDMRLRSIAIEQVEAKLNLISVSQRDAMYENARMLFLIKTLASFLFDRLIMAFNHKTPDETAVCFVAVVHTQLEELCDILFSLKKIPSIDLLSALFIFSMAEYQNDEDFDQDKELQKFIQKAEKSIMTIRSFNKNVPLLKIIRCVNRNFRWEPQELSGGEDWFLCYKNYWLETTNKNFIEWIHERRNTELLEEFNAYFKGALLQPIENALSNEKENNMQFDGALSLSFLLTFHKLIFMPEINVVIRPILVDGEFYKKENRIEFIESYNILIKLDDTIKTFDAELAPSGEYGKAWTQIAGNMHSLSVRRRKTQALLDDINTKVENIIEESKKSLVSMGHVLEGIVIHDENSKYDTLVNYAKLAGKGTVFIDGLNSAIQNLKTAISIIDDISEALKMDI